MFLPKGLLTLAGCPQEARHERLLELEAYAALRRARAVEDVSFSVAPGEVIGVIGPNGAGKTTLVNVITGVHAASAGRVRFDGRDITGIKPWQAARLGIARTFQVVQPFPDMTVIENVAAAAMFAGAARYGAEATMRLSSAFASSAWPSSPAARPPR